MAIIKNENLKKYLVNTLTEVNKLYILDEIEKDLKYNEYTLFSDYYYEKSLVGALKNKIKKLESEGKCLDLSFVKYEVFDHMRFYECNYSNDQWLIENYDLDILIKIIKESDPEDSSDLYSYIIKDRLNNSILNKFKGIDLVIALYIYLLCKEENAFLKHLNALKNFLNNLD